MFRSVEQLCEEVEDEMDEAAAVPDAIELVFQVIPSLTRSLDFHSFAGLIQDCFSSSKASARSL